MMKLPSRGAVDDKPPTSVGVIRDMPLTFAGSLSTLIAAKVGPYVRLFTSTLYLAVLTRVLS